MLEKLKSVQNATALKVLGRYYKNVTSAEKCTQIEDEHALSEKKYFED